ncbi:MAG TPA: asparaginase [candidate division Zixibacteria bacterium]|nr:asparaginase [candidate division Zixibacteria bacterium]
MHIQHCEVAARVVRGNGVEAVHTASIVVVNADKRITHAFGDPHLQTFTRSSIKPFQALPLVTSGAADRFKLTEKELAIACGSHNGTDDHKLTAESILAKAGNRPEHLQCGCHWPAYMRMKNIYPLGDEDRDPSRNNCSGKHAGFLAVARHLDADVATYLEPDSPVQVAVRRGLGEALECDIEAAPRGVDGCSAPNYAVPLYHLALGFLKLATATEGPLARIAAAMRAYPEMVSGKDRFDLALAQTFPSNVVSKVGAEAVQGIAFRDPALALVVKTHDGATRALNPICVEALRQLGLLKSAAGTPLEKYARPQVTNHRGTLTGEIVAEFELKAKAKAAGLPVGVESTAGERL